MRRLGGEDSLKLDPKNKAFTLEDVVYEPEKEHGRTRFLTN